MSDTRKCPMRSHLHVPEWSVGVRPDPVVVVGNCLGEKCAMWQTVYTTESITISDCAFALAPHMNADGRYAV